MDYVNTARVDIKITSINDMNVISTENINSVCTQFLLYLENRFNDQHSYIFFMTSPKFPDEQYPTSGKVHTQTILSM
jgi:hypothetical protein